ncbi:hypothetical protein ACTPEM_26610, partial [Clostridioides difficile]
IVLVHGGGAEINKMLAKVDIESKFVNGLRYTDEETMEIVKMVSSSVYLRPFTNLLSISTFASILLISAPPPCTKTILIPT